MKITKEESTKRVLDTIKILMVSSDLNTRKFLTALKKVKEGINERTFTKWLRTDEINHTIAYTLIRGWNKIVGEISEEDIEVLLNTDHRNLPLAFIFGSCENCTYYHNKQCSDPVIHKEAALTYCTIDNPIIPKDIWLKLRKFSKLL